MRQPSLHQVLGVARPSHAREPGGRLPVYDFFAGAGGFSEGARQAGCDVVWACDNDPLALKTHAANHPRAEHCLAELPMPRGEWPFPTDGRPFHVHFSPPCQKFSTTNTLHRTEGDRGGAADLITWSVETALASGATSWSLEEVASKHVAALLEAVRKRHPTRVAYAAFDLAELGVPQTRKRLLAGPPALISRLMRQRARGNTRSVRDVIAKPRGTHIRNGKSWVGSKQCVPGHGIWYHKAGWGDNCQPIDRPAPTVLANRGYNWVTRTATGYERSRLNVAEYSLLQTFPSSYRWPAGASAALKLIGNAVPPLVAQLLLGGSALSRPASPSLTRTAPAVVWLPGETVRPVL
tara:strand:- start:37 stop:1089 length:1053 start_codon:yes stop_codon:yes gene_type:complete